jgi:hypothetical protein
MSEKQVAFVVSGAEENAGAEDAADGGRGDSEELTRRLLRPNWRSVKGKKGETGEGESSSVESKR